MPACPVNLFSGDERFPGCGGVAEAKVALHRFAIPPGASIEFWRTTPYRGKIRVVRHRVVIARGASLHWAKAEIEGSVRPVYVRAVVVARLDRVIRRVGEFRLWLMAGRVREGA